MLSGPYLQRLKDGKLARRTWEHYDSIVLNHLDGVPLGEMPIGDIQTGDVDAWWRALTIPATVDEEGKIIKSQRPMAPSSQVRYLGFLSGVFETARKAKIIDSNPVRDAHKPYVNPDDVDFRIYSFEETVEILAIVKAWEDREDRRRVDENRAAREPHQIGRLTLATLLGLHGFGPAEMCGLAKKDLVDGGLLPKRQGQRGKIVDRLKARQRRQWVPLDDKLLKIVQGLPDGFLLATNAERTKPLSDNNLRRAFQGAMKGSTYADLSPYDLRHTFAMRLLEEGVDVQTAAELMRHSTQTFLRRYVRSREALKRDAIRRVAGGKGALPTQETNPKAA